MASDDPVRVAVAATQAWLDDWYRQPHDFGLEQPPAGNVVEVVLQALDTFDGLSWIAQQMLDHHYPADLPLVCDRNSPDPGARLTAALRDCIAARANASEGDC